MRKNVSDVSGRPSRRSRHRRSPAARRASRCDSAVAACSRAWSTSWSSAPVAMNAVAAPMASTSAPTSSERHDRPAAGASTPSNRSAGTRPLMRSILSEYPTPAHRPHAGRAAQLRQLAPHVRDVEVDDVRVDVGLGAPDRIQDLLARDDPALVADQVGQQSKLARGEIHALLPDPGDVALLVELEIAGREARRRGDGRAPAERANPGEQLGERERLGQVVVRARRRGRPPGHRHRRAP